MSVINKIENNFPSFFNCVKNVYHSTSLYKTKLKKIKMEQDYQREIKNKYELKIIKEVFDNEYVVRNGPFKGMLYIKNSVGSQLLPKILGSYEEPIQHWIKKIINKNYDKILDIGCAEGYYAVGFARSCLETEIFAHDINPDAILLAQKLAKLNNISNIHFKNECNHEELEKQCDKNVFVFCDIEGNEKDLLDLNKVPNLERVDLLVEAHDWLVPNITDLLVKRFYYSHKIHIVIDYPFRRKNYVTLHPVMPNNFKNIYDEKRPEGMKFLFMESKKNDYI